MSLPPLLTHGGPDGPLAYRVHGHGPPLVLLHGFPQTHAMWDHIAPVLARDFSVITPDLRGYGDSLKPAHMEDMSFRAMARDVVHLMAALGHPRFHLAGHDRGGRVAHRLALDSPDCVASLCVMDIVPTLHLLETLTHTVARAYYHWLYLAQPAPFPETMIGADPDFYFERCLLGFGKANLSDFSGPQLAAYRHAWRNPDAIRCMCNDYRAAIDVDILHDKEDDRAGLAVTCPAFVLYGRDGAMARMLNVPDTWKGCLSDYSAAPISGGHFFPDQHPTETAQALLQFHGLIQITP